MTSEAPKAKISANALLRKVNQYRNYLEEYKKRFKEVRESSKGIQDKNTALIKENATLRQAAASQAEAFIAVKEELVVVKTAYGELVNQLESERVKIAQYELERQSSRHLRSSGLSAVNADVVAQRVWDAMTRRFEHDLFSVFSQELKSAIDARDSLAQASHVLSPQQRCLRNSLSDAPDSMKRFVKVAGHPRLASTPLRSGPVANAVIQSELPELELPSEPAPLPVFRAPAPIVRPPRQNPNPPAIPAISEEHESELSVQVVGVEEEDEEERMQAPLPPLKPKPSRSAPVKGNKMKQPVVLKAKARSRSRTPSSTSNNEAVRVQTKVLNGRVESRVANSIFQEADEEKKTRSLKRKPPVIEVVPKKAEPSVFDFSMTDHVPEKEPRTEVEVVQSVAETCDRNEVQMILVPVVTLEKIPANIQVQSASRVSIEGILNTSSVPIDIPPVDAAKKSRTQKRKLSESQQKKVEVNTIASEEPATSEVSVHDPQIEEPAPVNNVHSDDEDRPVENESNDHPRQSRSSSSSRPHSSRFVNGGSDADSVEEDGATRSRLRRAKAIQSYAEPPLNAKLRRKWDPVSQQFVLYKAK